MIVENALDIAYSFATAECGEEKRTNIGREILKLTGVKDHTFKARTKRILSYDETQNTLSKLNEREAIRKSKGVYYTPNDVVQFIVANSVKSLYGKLSPDNISEGDLKDIPYKAFATKRTVFDPTCGAGEFLLAAFNMKLDLLEKHLSEIPEKIVIETVSTIYGNDVNTESVAITKLRLFLCAIHRYGEEKCRNIPDAINRNFFSYDYILTPAKKKYDIIVGNPPYVEDSKSGLDLEKKDRYGNIYANVLIKASGQLTKNGSMGFVIPLSYVSTPRMKNLREQLMDAVSEQFIMSYADRPDCLFDNVHQKLCILIGKKKKNDAHIYTGNYQYWYKEERDQLFSKTKIIRNDYKNDNYIPKLGTALDISIYRKIMLSEKMESVYDVSRKGEHSVYLNRRETFWMKAYRKKVDDPEYKVFSFQSKGLADYCYCLINSSLFWWYWIATSDCWHVSRELNGFKAPFDKDISKATELANGLRKRLEETKVYVGTKQTEYEYKHKDCISEIHQIDDFVNSLYDLSKEESRYIKDFAFIYRTSGGPDSCEGN